MVEMRPEEGVPLWERALIVILLLPFALAEWLERR